MNHLTREQLEAFVSGESPADPVGFRRHLAECEACARRLANAARFEEQLEQAAGRIAACRTAARRATRARIALAAAAALIMFIAAGFVMWRASRSGPVSASPRLVPPAPAFAQAMVSSPGAPSPPGLEARIPRLCEDCVSPADLCRYSQATVWPAAHAPLPASASFAESAATP